MLQYQDRKPLPCLLPFIKYYGQISIPRLRHTATEFVIPSLGKGLVFWDVYDTPLFIDNGTYRQPVPSAFIMGQGAQPSRWKHRGGLTGFAVIFRPGQLRKFFRANWLESLDSLIPIEDYEDQQLLELRDRIRETSDFKLRCQLADQFFLQGLSRLQLQQDSADYFLTELHQNPGLSLRQIAASTGYSERHFHRVFTGKIGISPKSYQKLCRVNLALGWLYRNPSIRQTSLAYELGYSDQAHFSNQFRHYLGRSPREFIRSMDQSMNVKSGGLDCLSDY